MEGFFAPREELAQILEIPLANLDCRRKSEAEVRVALPLEARDKGVPHALGVVIGRLGVEPAAGVLADMLELDRRDAGVELARTDDHERLDVNQPVGIAERDEGQRVARLIATVVLQNGVANLGNLGGVEVHVDLRQQRIERFLIALLTHQMIDRVEEPGHPSHLGGAFVGGDALRHHRNGRVMVLAVPAVRPL